jgi:hopanoid-associated phosphorylase
MSVLVIVGLAAEARIAAAPRAATLISGGRREQIAADLEAAVAMGAKRLLSFGVAGAIAPTLRPGDLIVARGLRVGQSRAACDPDWREGMLGSLRGWAAGAKAALVEDDILGVDAVVADPGAKARLFAATRAAAVDMESAEVARAAARHGLPFAILRAVADPAERALPPAALVAMRADGGIDLSAMMASLARRPGQLPELARLAFDSRRAFAALGRARAFLGPQFASLDLGEL